MDTSSKFHAVTVTYPLSNSTMNDEPDRRTVEDSYNCPMNETLNHYLSLWVLSDPQILAQTPTSHVYTVTRAGKTVILKLLTEYGWEEQRGAAALRYYDGHGA